jgi:hypothetical protein
MWSIFDVVIAIILASFLKANNKEEKNNKYIEIIYLFNPISILACSKLSLSIFYNLINFLMFKNDSRILYIFSLLITPQYAITNTFYMIYSSKKSNKFIGLIIVLSILAFSLFYTDLFVHYKNYFLVKDSLPNLSVLWSLIPEVLLII